MLQPLSSTPHHGGCHGFFARQSLDVMGGCKQFVVEKNAHQIGSSSHVGSMGLVYLPAVHGFYGQICLWKTAKKR